MIDCYCPYCGMPQEICHDDGAGYAEDVLHQMTCGDCEKMFVFRTSIHFTYAPRKADCLNDGQHQYERTKTYPPQFAVMRCRDCGDEQPLREVAL